MDSQYAISSSIVPSLCTISTVHRQSKLTVGKHPDQSGSVPPNGWHLVPLNLGLAAPYPITCHLAFDDQHHTALTTNSSNSGTFNITNVSDQNPQVYGAGDSLVAPSTASAGTAPTGTETADPNSFDSGGGLSDGDIAGIVVGTVLGLGVVVGLFVFFCLRRRRRLRHYKAERWEAVPTTAPAAPEDMQKTEYTQNAEDDIVRELDGEERNRTSELPTEVQKGRK